MKRIIFTGVTPQILRIYFSLLRNSWIFRRNTSHIKWHLIKYNNQYLLYELSHYMFKISTAGWHTYLQSIAVVFHSVVNGFLRQGRPNQLKCICKLGNCFQLRLQLVIRLQHFPKLDNPLDWGQMNWVMGTTHYWRWSYGDLTWYNLKLKTLKDGYSLKN